MAVSKAARIRALEAILEDPATSSYTRVESMKELRRLTEPKRRQRSSRSSVDARVAEWYREYAADVPPPRMPKGADPAVWESEVCDVDQAARYRAVNRIVWRGCCGRQAFECRCAAPVTSALET